MDFARDPITKSAIVNQYYETSLSGLFVCGNALHVHDLVDFVSVESEKAGKNAQNYILNGIKKSNQTHKIEFNENIRYVVPQMIDFETLSVPLDLSFRVTKKMGKGIFKIIQDGEIIYTKKAKHLAPAEMEKLTLKPEILLNKNPISILLEEVIIRKK